MHLKITIKGDTKERILQIIHVLGSMGDKKHSTIKFVVNIIIKTLVKRKVFGVCIADYLYLMR